MAEGEAPQAGGLEIRVVETRAIDLVAIDLVAIETLGGSRYQVSSHVTSCDGGSWRAYDVFCDQFSVDLFPFSSFPPRCLQGIGGVVVGA